MPLFDVPKTDLPSLVTLVSVSAVAEMSLSESQIDEIRSRLPFSDGGYHAKFREAVEWGGAAAELRGIIGFHDFEVVGDEHGKPSSTRRRYAHVDLDLWRTSEPEPFAEGDWETAQSAAAALSSEYSFAVSLRVRAPTDSLRTVHLPLPLPSSTSLGFSHITGVRLAKLSDASDDEELYSVVADRTKKGLTLLATVRVNCPLGADTLARAQDRAWLITSFAIGGRGDE
jgi:hypothetical protein